MEDEKISVTYDTLLEMLRNEKSREEIQKINTNFYLDAIHYLNEKQQMLKNTEHKTDLFFATEKTKLSIQAGNIVRTLKELYDRRERKIIDMAINKSRTGSSIIDTANLLHEEKILFDKLTSVLMSFRNGVINNVLSGNSPQIIEAKDTESKPVESSGVDKKEDSESSSEAKEDGKKTKFIRFKVPVPKFVGKDLEVYGPFEEEDMASLPTDVANVLINKDRAEEMDQ